MCKIMIQSLTCTPNRPVHSYKIAFHSNLFENISILLHGFSNFKKNFAIIADDKVASLYGQSLYQALKELGLNVHLFCFPEGEHSKTRQTKEKLENQLFECQLGRDTCVIALGGGVVTDLAGYLASTYCRGVSLILIPTSLLAMVDASIGGKTGVNVPWGKNLIGTFYPPEQIIIDSTFLTTLPIKELKNGCVEMIKHGLIADENYFSFLEEHGNDLLNIDHTVLKTAIWESCRIKLDIVQEDEKEEGKRHLLNFGHTVGHALEKITQYQLTHGEAVALGIVVEAYLSYLNHDLSIHDFERIKMIFQSYQIPLICPFKIDIDQIIEAMIMDKKSLNRQPRFVLLKKIGEPVVNQTFCHAVKSDLLLEALSIIIEKSK